MLPFNADSSLLYRVLWIDSFIYPSNPYVVECQKNASPLYIIDKIKIDNWINEGDNEYSLHTFESKIDLNIINIAI